MTVPAITWWGHATATVQDSGVTVLTDPLFTGRLAHLRRLRGPASGAIEAGATVADLVVISHLHADHLHIPSLARLRAGTRVLLPAGALAAVPGLGRLRRRLDLVEVIAGDEVSAGPVRVRAVPALHDGRRWPFGERKVHPLGYVISGAAVTYFAGDTDLYADLPAAVGACDVALLPVGGWGPRLGDGHLDPRRAAIALSRLAARAAIPVHFGTFCPYGMRPGRWFHRPGRDFTTHAKLHAPDSVVHELDPGASINLATRLAAP
jgi:L-ascorbate metabolism protein UlaG (beta-lactamase superfamily)